MHQFNALRSEVQQGTLSDSDFAEKISTQILAPWQPSWKAKCRDAKFGPLDIKKQRLKFLHAMRLRQESFEDWIAAAHGGENDNRYDQGKAGTPVSKGEEADKIEHDTFGEEDEQ